MSTTPEERWKQLREAGIPADDLWVQGTGTHTAWGEVRRGVDGAGQYHLLLPVMPGAFVVEDTTGEAVQIRPRELIAPDRSRVALADVVLLKPHLVSAYARMTEEVLSAVAAEPKRPDAAAAMVLGRWRELLAALPEAPLGEEALTGLFGELHVLRVLAEAGQPADRWWTGYDRHRHDFCAPQCDIEVKTTRAADSQTVSINGLTQLDPPAGGRLLLVLVRVEAGGATGETLPEAVRTVLSAARDPAALERALADAGYSSAHDSSYKATRLRVREVVWHDVKEDFPRLSPRHFAAGHPCPAVSAIGYALDLSHATAFRVDPASIWAVQSAG